MSDICKRLSEPFPPDTVSWRIGSTNQDKSRAMALAYIDARDVMNRLDAVCGPFGWQSEHVVTGDMVTCHIRIRDPESGEWIAKSDGAGKTDVEGEKGSYSDALKRSAVVWGVGRYLYDTDSPWVEIEPKGKSYVIKQSEFQRLRARLAGVKDRPPRAAPSGEASPPKSKGREAYDRIYGMIDAAKLPSEIEEIIKTHGADLAYIKEVGPKTYESLMGFANGRKISMLTAA